METKIWFKKKKYGWGWTPATKEGWLATVGYIFGVSIYPLLGSQNIVSYSKERFYLFVFVLSISFIGLCYWKGEKASWNWGK